MSSVLVAQLIFVLSFIIGLTLFIVGLVQGSALWLTGLGIYIAFLGIVVSSALKNHSAVKKQMGSVLK